MLKKPELKWLRTLLSSGLVCGLTALSPQSAKAGLLGFYLGAGVGQGSVKIDKIPGGSPLGFDKHHVAWQALVGVRPISILGAELNYFDFGEASAAVNTPAIPVSGQINASVKGAALYAVGYLPLPLPLLDIYGKAGVAHLQADSRGLFSGIFCVVAGCDRFQSNRSDTTFAWGAGAQVKLPITSLSIRAEYQHFNASNGAPSLLSASVLWRF